MCSSGSSSKAAAVAADVWTEMQVVIVTLTVLLSQSLKVIVEVAVMQMVSMLGLHNGRMYLRYQTIGFLSFLVMVKFAGPF